MFLLQHKHADPKLLFCAHPFQRVTLLLNQHTHTTLFSTPPPSLLPPHPPLQRAATTVPPYTWVGKRVGVPVHGVDGDKDDGAFGEELRPDGHAVECHAGVERSRWVQAQALLHHLEEVGSRGGLGVGGWGSRKPTLTTDSSPKRKGDWIEVNLFP